MGRLRQSILPISSAFFVALVLASAPAMAQQLNSISGTKFNDLNGNGTQDPGEPGRGGVTIFLDSNANGFHDSGEPSTTSDTNGLFSFLGLGPGTYRVREVLPAGFSQTTANPADIVVSSGQNITGVIFGNFQRVSISGTKFNDLNVNGIRDPGEPGVGGVTIQLYLAPNTIVATTTTDANGNYTFSNLGPGTYRVREVVPAGSLQSSADPADIVALSGTNATGVNFGNAPSGAFTPSATPTATSTVTPTATATATATPTATATATSTPTATPTVTLTPTSTATPTATATATATFTATPFPFLPAEQVSTLSPAALALLAVALATVALLLLSKHGRF